MMACRIEIKQVPGKEWVSMDMSVENAGGTEIERKFSGLLDRAIKAAMITIAQKVGGGQMIEGSMINDAVKSALLSSAGKNPPPEQTYPR